MNFRLLSIGTDGAAVRKEKIRGQLVRMADLGPVRRLREISETLVTPRVRAELTAQSGRVGSVEQHLPRLLNTINSSDGSARLLSRRLDELRADLDAGRYEAALQAGRTSELRWLDERLTRTTAELASLTEAVRSHADTQAWLLGRVELIRSEMLHELRYGAGRSRDRDDRPPVEILEPGVLDLDDGEIRLNLGCGHKPMPGYANVDGRRLPGVDVVAPVDELPVKPGTVTEIYSAHLLEHFPEEQLRRSLLPYWVGLLRPGGVFRAVVPDLEAMTKAYVRGELDFDQLRSVTYGGQEYEGDTHYNGFTAAHLSTVLTDAGLTGIQVIAEARPEGDCLELELSAVRPGVMRVSVVVCTYNRAQSLLETLEALRHQTYDQFEVVVVNGPSTDGTRELLDTVAAPIKIVDNPLANLSVSRNLGIRASGGEVVAFIDDDALPEFDWLAQSVPAFADPEVAGAGGIVFDHTGMALQYRYSATNRFGEVQFRDDAPYDELCYPGSFVVPYLQGTNALFRRDALARVGLFDETFDFYLDETDVCLRLVDAGLVLRQLPTAPVHHKFLPSHVRNHERVVTNWFPIVKNFAYFGYRHALDHVPEHQVIERSTGFGHRLIEDAHFHERGGRLPAGSGQRCAQIVGDAIATGIALGRERRGWWLRPERLDRPAFQPYPTIGHPDRRRYVLVSSGHPPTVTGGIARYIGEVAPAIVARGHEVRVITRAEHGGTVDLENGVWVHRIETPGAGGVGALPDAPGYVDAFASAVVAEVARLSAWSTPDLVYGPAWDVEVLGVVRRLPVPVALFLATPLAVVAEHSALSKDPAVADLLALERELFGSADLAHGDSHAVLDTIAERYGQPIDPDRAGVAHLGLADRPPEAEPSEEARRFLFVGRLEPRKGIDTLLDAFMELAAGRPGVELVVVGADGVPPGGDGRSYVERFTEDNAGHHALEQVRFLGRVDDDELEEWHRWADCLVLPSRYESFGLTMLHGMLSRRAVISCDAGAVGEVVRHRTDGLLVPPGDVAALAAAMRRVVDEPGLARKLAVNGRARFEEAFSIETAAEALLALFDRVRIDRDPVVRVEGDAVRGDVGGFPAVTLGPAAVAHLDGAESAVRHVLAIAPAGPAELDVVSVNGRRRRVTVGHRMARIPIDPRDPVALAVSSGRVTVHGMVCIEPEGD